MASTPSDSSTPNPFFQIVVFFFVVGESIRCLLCFQRTFLTTHPIGGCGGGGGGGGSPVTEALSLSNSGIRILTYTLGYDVIDDMNRIACGTAGAVYRVANMSVLSQVVGAYHQMLGTPTSMGHVQYSAPYLDNGGLGLVISMSVPVYYPGTTKYVLR